MVEFYEVLEQFNTLPCFDFVHTEEVFAHLQLKATAFFLHFLGEVCSSDLGPDHS